LDGASGQLSSIATVAAKDASRVAVDPSGRFLFACGDDSWPGVIPRLPGPAGGVLEFRLDSTTGQPTALGRVGDEPCDFLAPDPSGRFLYVSRARSADVFAYRIDDSTGSLAPLGTVRNERAGWIGFAAFDR
jgi:6-phosphogluconolactonase (cycloisomerase 2 family)